MYGFWILRTFCTKISLFSNPMFSRNFLKYPLMLTHAKTQGHPDNRNVLSVPWSMWNFKWKVYVANANSEDFCACTWKLHTHTLTLYTCLHTRPHPHVQWKPWKSGVARDTPRCGSGRVANLEQQPDRQDQLLQEMRDQPESRGHCQSIHNECGLTQ